MDSIILPISVDSVPTLKEFKSKLGIGIDMLSDFKRDVSRAYGTLMDDKFYSRRAYFLIDRTGRLAWKHVEVENKQRRQDDELLAHIKRVSAQQPCIGVSRVIFEPMVCTMRQPPSSVPSPMAA